MKDDSGRATPDAEPYPQPEPSHELAVVDAHDDTVVPYTYRGENPDDVIDAVYAYDEQAYDATPRYVRPILPDWATSPRAVWVQFTDALRRVNRWFWHHLIRLPMYVGKWFWYMLVGFGVSLPRIWTWVVDPDGYDSAIMRMRMGRSTARISDEIKGHRRMRLARFVFAFLVVPFGPLVAGSIWLAYFDSGRRVMEAIGFGRPALVVAGAELVVMMIVFAPLGWYHLGKPQVTTTLPREPSSLCQERMEEVLWALKLLPAPKYEQENPISYIRVVGMPHRTPPPASGTEMRWQFPKNSGRKAKDIIELDEEVASEFAVKTVQVVIEEGDTPNEVVTWIADRDPFEGVNTPGPYPALPRTDIWQDVRFGITPRHEPFLLPVMWGGELIAGAPGFGKTTIGRIIALVAAKDPFCDIHVMNFKGGNDWSALKDIAITYVNGVETDDIEKAMDAAQALVNELDRRFDMFENELSDDDGAEGRITPELARSHGLRPILLLIDELQEVLDAMTDREERDRFIGLLGRFFRRARAVGGMPIVMTQRPSSSDKTGAVPAQLKSQLATRIAVYCTDQDSSIAVLGKGSVGKGADASKLPARPGIGIVLKGGINTMVKFDAPTIKDLREAARVGLELRKRAGTLHSSTLPRQTRRESRPGIDPPLRGAHIEPDEEVRNGGPHLMSVGELRPLLPPPYDTMHPTALGKLLAGEGLRPRRVDGRASYDVGEARAAVAHHSSKNSSGHSSGHSSASSTARPDEEWPEETYDADDRDDN